MSTLRPIAALLVILSAVPARSEPRSWAWQSGTAPFSASSGRGGYLGDEAALCELPRVDRARTGSRACLGCHDGTLTAAAIHRGGVGASSHPVEIDYQVARLRRPAALHPQAFLPRNLVLPDGKVTCTTCHDGRSREADHVAGPMAGSALCLSCHSL